MINLWSTGPWINPRNITIITATVDDEYGNYGPRVTIDFTGGKNINIRCSTIEEARTEANRICSEIKKHDSVA